MEIDENDLEKKKKNIELEYKRKSIYILHYPKGKLNVSYGIINDIIDEKINHYCNTEEGSSGSPILSLKSFKIIGIHYGCSQNNKKLNIGTFIKYAINEFNNNYNKYKNEINLIYIGNNEKEIIFGKEFMNIKSTGTKKKKKKLSTNKQK